MQSEARTEAPHPGGRRRQVEQRRVRSGGKPRHRRRIGVGGRSIPDHSGGPNRRRHARPRRGRRSPNGDRRVSLVHRLGPRHHDLAGRADALHRPLRRGGVDSSDLLPLRSRRFDPQPVSRAAHRRLYHTADATLWFFHALDRYTTASGDRSVLEMVLPKLLDIFEWHVRGTAFGIGVDRAMGY
jgi:hypothetical protein